jgi:chromate transporter
MTHLVILLMHIAVLSLMAFGGVATVLPELHRFLVEEHGWISEPQFGALYALSQAAPGPNMLYVALFGLQIAGIPGAVSCTLAMITPSSLLAIGFARYTTRHPEAGWYRHLRAALTPVSIGMVLASGWILARNTDTTPMLLLLTLATTLLHWRTKINPVWLIAVGAGLGGLHAL